MLWVGGRSLVGWISEVSHLPGARGGVIQMSECGVWEVTVWLVGERTTVLTN